MSEPVRLAPITVDTSTVVGAKKVAMLLLKQLKNNEPLDQAQLALVLRGYIGLMDLIVAVLG